MKTIQKISGGMALGFSLVLFLTSCKDDLSDGSARVRLTDAPALYSEVNVEILSVSVHYEDEHLGNKGWVTLESNAGVYNLLKLQNDVTVVLSDDQSLPLGKVTQIRLMLGDDNSVISSGVSYELKVPSGYESGVKIGLNTDLKFNKTIDIILDFDADKSVIMEGNGSFTLKPVIKVESIVEL